MNLNNFNLLKETDDSYHLTSKEGKQFIVQKDKLSSKAHELIKKLKSSEAQPMYNGGSVDYMDQNPNAYNYTYDTNLKDDKKTNKEILKSSQKRSNNEQLQKTKEEMISPEEYADGGDVGNYSTQPSLANMSSMQLPNQQSTGEPASTIPGFDSIHKTPAQLMDIATQYAGVAGPTAEVAPLEEAVAPVARQVGHDLMGMASDATESALKNIGQLTPEHQELLRNMQANALAAAEENFGPQTKAVLNRLSPNEAIAKVNSLPEIRNLRVQAQKYYNRATGSLAGSAGDVINPGNRFADGGEATNQPDWVKQGVNQQENDAGAMSPTNMSMPPSSPDSSVSPISVTTTPQTNAPSSNQVQGMPDFSTPLKEEKAGLLQQAQAVSGQGAAEVNALDKLQEGLKALPSQQDVINQNKQKDDGLFQAYHDAKIDPNRLFHEADTSNKVLAGIGVFLSGIGSGLTGQPNLAIKTIDNAINRDIDAQKNDQSNKFNLWKMNRERLGSDLQANLATRNQMMTDVKYQLARAASQFKGPQAMAQYQMGVAKIDQELAQNNYLRSLLTPTSESIGGSSAGTEQAFLNHNKSLQLASNMSPIVAQQYKENEGKYIPSVGVASIVPTPAEKTELSSMSDLKRSLQNAVNFQQSGPGANIGAWSPENRRRANDIQQDVVTKMGPMLYGLKRFNPELASRFESRAGNPGSFDAFGSNAAGYKQLLNDVQQRENVLHDHLGIVPFQKAPVDMQAIDWAKRNSSDPRAIKILQANGQ